MLKQKLFPSSLYIAYLFILCWSPLPFASNRPWAWSLLSIFCLVLAIAILWQAFKLKLNIAPVLRRHWLSLFLFGFVATWVTIQSIPLPQGVVQILSPDAAAFFNTTTAETFTLSLEPAFTRQMAILSWVYYLFFIMTLLLVDSSRRLRLLLSVIILSGVFQAIYGSYMTLSGIEYSFFMPKEAYIGNATGTFINRNHLAGYLEMCLAVGIGLLVASMRDDKQQSWRQHLRQLLDTFLGSKIRLRVYLAIMVIALVLTRSRMGNTAFFLSLPICGLLMMMLQGRINRHAIVLFLSLLLVDVLIVGQWFGFEELAARIQSTSAASETRDEVVRDTWTLFNDYKVSGTGVGTFYSSFPQYRGGDVKGFYEHAHNDYLEFASTFGLIGIIPLMALVITSLFLALKVLYKRKDKLMKGAAFAALMGIISLLIHSLVDFNLQIPANALLFIVLLGIAHISRSLPGSSGILHSSGLSIG